MNKSSFLISYIQEKFGYSQKEAEKFVSSLFDVLNNALREDKQVKVKGLGTFKVTSVSARESVNVNTGERFLIESRDKITFTPDASMRDRVNAPFSQFETVVLSDDVDFTEIDEKYKLSEEMTADEIAGGDEEKENIPEDTTVEQSDASFLIKTETGHEAVEKHLKEELNPLSSSQLMALNAFAHAAKDEKMENIQLLANEEEKKTTMSENDMEAENTDTGEVLRENFVEQKKEQFDTPYVQPIDELLDDRLQRSLRMTKIMTFVCVILVVISSMVIYYLARQLALRDNRIEHLEAFMVKKQQIVSKNKTINQDKVRPNKDTLAQNINGVAQKVAVEEPHKVVEEEKKTEDKDRKETVSFSNAPSAKPNYMKDPRVRTGAYIIVGVAKTITVRKGQTLASISLAQLGPGMECYVEAINGKTSFEAGENIKIPELKLKKRR